MSFTEASRLPEAPEGFTVSWTPGEVTTLPRMATTGSGSLACFERVPRPANCIRLTCNACNAYWDGEGPDYVKAVTFHGSHQRLCRKRSLGVVRANIARMIRTITSENGWPVADHLLARELDYAESEYGEQLLTYEEFMRLLTARLKKIARKRSQ